MVSKHGLFKHRRHLLNCRRTEAHRLASHRRKITGLSINHRRFHPAGGATTQGECCEAGPRRTVNSGLLITGFRHHLPPSPISVCSILTVATHVSDRGVFRRCKKVPVTAATSSKARHQPTLCSQPIVECRCFVQLKVPATYNSNVLQRSIVIVAARSSSSSIHG
ncbi:unnamed protein product [Linum trigynum]|uniref:Uncharacterized protein n=1 Tax=Linum trigynum TaxID=586398 RepID=A0AAV2CMT2_9ROSI